MRAVSPSRSPDILGIDDKTAWLYHEALRRMITEIAPRHLRLYTLEELTEERDRHRNNNLEDFSAMLVRTREVLDAASHDTSTSSLEDHFREALGLTEDVDASQKADQGRAKVQRMLRRNVAYRHELARRAGSHIRITIHAGGASDRLAMDLFPPGTNPDGLVPWRAAAALTANGALRILDPAKVDLSGYDVQTCAEGTPWLLRAKSALFNWPGMRLNFEPLHPCGIQVTPEPGHGPYRLEDVDMSLVRKLALSTAPLLLRGFTMTPEKAVFRERAAQLGTIQQWPFGDILEVRENADFNMNNVLTNEAMPFHYDGVFRIVKDPVTGQTASSPPLFQMFRCKSAEHQVGGLTLFSSSRNFLALLSKDPTQLQWLRSMKWRTFTARNDAFGGDELVLPFVSPHPETGRDVFRWHEPWPAEKCIGASSEPTMVEAVPLMDADAERRLHEDLVRLLYDARNCYRHQWQEGDVVINDNISTHHTRTAFDSGERELWRVHVN
ncbi:unnamed protein product [Parajaminaea phylloscopi]